MKRTIIFLLLSIFQITLFGKGDVIQNTTQILSLTIEKMDGTLNWTTKNEHVKKTYIVEQYKWNKWLKVGEVTSIGTPEEHKYQFKTQPHYGENDFRISITDEPNTIKVAKFISNVAEVTFEIHKNPKMIQFTSETRYEIIDKKGIIVKVGFGSSIPLKDLHHGHYILNYDNFSASFKL